MPLGDEDPDRLRARIGRFQLGWLMLAALVVPAVYFAIEPAVEPLGAAGLGVAILLPAAVGIAFVWVGLTLVQVLQGLADP